MITYLHWTSILWLQAGMMGASIIVSFFVLPNAPVAPPKAPGTSNSRYLRFKSILAEFDPSPVFQVMIYPNVTLTVSFWLSSLPDGPMSHSIFECG